MKLKIFLFTSVFSFSAWAYESQSMFVDPHVAVGFNVAQGTFVLLGADAGYALSEQLAIGVGGYLAAGKSPSHDREIGAGPFATYMQPLTSFLVAQVREDVDYIDQRMPITDSKGEVNSHWTVTGVASVTTLGLHIKFTPIFGVSGGYRAILPLTNSDLGKDRSGMFLGFSIGI